MLNPLASPWIPVPLPSKRVVPQPWVAPLEAAWKRLLLAALHHPHIIREAALLETISQLLPRAREPLKFTAYPAQLQVSSDGKRVSKHRSDRWGQYRTAVCTSAPMTRGVHYAEFRLIKKTGWVRVGVVNAELRRQPVESGGTQPPGNGVETGQASISGFDAVGGGSATATAMGWGYNTALGSCWHDCGFSDWVGQRVAETGDVVGLRLDVDHGCIDVFINYEHLGRMVDHSVILATTATVTNSPGHASAERVDETTALCWMVELHDTSDEVEIVGKQPPPRPG